MPRLKVLFADDQIPDENIPDNEIISVIRKRFPNADPGFIKAFLPMRETVKTLKDGYDVTIANTTKRAMDLVNANHYDIAIVDLRWSADKEVPNGKKDNFGMDICDAIEAADKRTASKPTFQIICSNRFKREPNLAMLAAQKLKLPVYKSYDEPFRQALLAAVNFIEKYVSGPSTREVTLQTVESSRMTVQSLLNEALTQEKRWATITIGLVALGVILILAGAIAVILGYAQAGTWTSISSVIPSVISGLLFKQLRSAQGNIDKSLKIAEQNYQDAMKQLSETEPKS